MTPSSRPADGFLFNIKRINVAVSRIPVLAKVFASLRLLEIACTTSEQMRLGNTPRT
jgi:hypothetical protein